MRHKSFHIDDLHDMENEYRAIESSDSASFADKMRAGVMADIVQGIASTMKGKNPEGWGDRGPGIREISVDLLREMDYYHPC